MQAKFHLKQITVALAAAGFGLAVGAGYNRLGAPALSLANAATPPAITSPVASTAAARLPDFTALVEREGALLLHVTDGVQGRMIAADAGIEFQCDPHGLERIAQPGAERVEIETVL